LRGTNNDAGKNIRFYSFGVYFGWITVTAIANFAVFWVSIGWNGFGIGDYVWHSFGNNTQAPVRWWF